VVDTSKPAAFGGIHIKGVYSIWLAGLPAFAGWVLPYDRPIILALEGQYHPEKAVHYLIRIGYDQIHGYLKGSIESWYNAGFPMESMRLLSVHQLRSILDQHERLTVLDTRGEEEWKSCHIEGAIHMYVGAILKVRFTCTWVSS
jgi:hydroxyacylglutathione hydrolase